MNSCRISVAVFSMFFGILSAAPVYSQSPQIEWGTIPQSDLSMSSFPNDTNATAVILFDIGETHMDDDLNLVYTKFTRIKILTDAGFSWGTHSVTLYTKDNTDRINEIEGATYAIGADGTTMKTEIGDNAIFEEKIDDNYTRVRFTLPKLNPGCVIEYRYKITSQSWHRMQNWTFQHSEPVLWSEYVVRIPPQIQYSGVTRGYETFYINEYGEASQIFQGHALTYVHTRLVRCNQNRWVVRNAPALRSEPYVTTIRDYATEVELQLAAYIDYRSGLPVKVLKDWETVVSELKASQSFGGRIDVSGDIRKTAEAICADASSPENKVKLIYDAVRTSIVWDGRNRVIADQSPDDVLKTKKGSSSDITFLLLSMLDAVGIKGYPVILSTRANGKVQLVYPILDQFNYVVAGITLNGVRLYLDATDAHRPYGELPVRILNTQGLLIHDGPVEWVNINTRKKYVHSATAAIALTEDGKAEGTVESVAEEYGALENRDDLDSQKEIDIATDVFRTQESGVTVDSASITGRENSDSPLKIRAHIVGEDYAQVSGNLLYVNPLVVNRRKRSPFTTPVRKYPVDMAYGSNIKTEILLTIPAGYQIKEPLTDRSVTFPNNALSYTRSFRAEGKIIRVTTEFQINEPEFPPMMYGRLRDFYNEMISLQNAQIVLERTAKSSK